jgi:Ca2+-binding RTX toxin-like protein
MNSARGKLLLAFVACLVFGLVVTQASANYHLMKVSEVATNPAGPDSAFIELQMYAPGQNQVGGHVVNYYTATGSLLGSTNIINNVPSGETQRTVLIGDTATAASPDVVNPALADALQTYGPGGAVCFENIDCISWGGFTGAGSLPSGTGNPAPAIPAGMSLTRSITPGCATLLESADDTNNSVTDFALASPSPRNNATVPTEKPCGPAVTPGKCRAKEATLTGTPGKDNLKGTNKRDVIAALGGKDTVNGRGGNDLICGNAAKDGLIGGKGKDTLVGGAGSDNLVGGPGGDTLIGQKGNDACAGGAGADVTKAC